MSVEAARSLFRGAKVFDLEDRVNLPPGGAPRVMILAATAPVDGRADVGARLIVLVVPQQVAGDADLVRLRAGRMRHDVGLLALVHERGELLHANARLVQRRFGS